ncbi:DegT/DnrJ/EryC1/StrS family aminotransferase [Acetomicrobium sp. S15 = DSM 107314]|uniref:DegT/DnrJ/EryC1/StrS family aminotransferase n=1 Tax=Acetomicrobium sp. S15 = DSM 107314 TaxID=2529858 RepID=UPI0018E19DDE|nr:DegT/DnrJ/EryC1/StrS family aminotransferase [Acetomicrobium sp. S15 = DSM 107314]
MKKEKKVLFNRLDFLYLKHEDEYKQAALRALRSGWYIMGPELEAFEKEFARYVGCLHCVGVNSGLDALTLSLRALGIGEGDEVIVQANTYIATVLAITENRAKPIFVEPDEFHGIDANLIETAITPKTKAIMVVHLYGQPCDMEPITVISKRTGIPLIEDCAQSHGSTYKDKMTGAFGILGCFSFYPTKNLGAFGDAGAVVTDNPVFADKLRALRNYGSKIKYQNETTGVNSRLDEIQAALLRIRLGHLEEILAEREAIAQLYLAGINNPTVRLPKVRPEARHTWHQFVVQCNNRDALQTWLKEKGIQTQIHYPIPPHLSKAYSDLGYSRGSFPITEHLANTVLSLPLYCGMTSDEIEYVVDTVNRFLDR